MIHDTYAFKWTEEHQSEKTYVIFETHCQLFNAAQSICLLDLLFV